MAGRRAARKAHSRYRAAALAEAALLPESAAQTDASLIRPYMPELDAVRGIAILLVLFFHGMAPPLHAQLSFFGRALLGLSRFGWTGVNLFFVLSGFLITGILLDGRQSPNYFRHFYTRRVLRILPALYAMLLVLLVGGWISWAFARLSIVFLANFAAVLGVGLAYGSLWSLAVEEQFYLLWPLLVRRASRRSLIILAIAVAVGSPFLRILNLIGKPVPEHLAFLYTWFNLDGLALGALLAIWLRAPSFCRDQLARIAPPVAVVSTLAFFLLAGSPWADATVVGSAANLASAGFLSCAMLAGTSRWRFLIDRPILKFFGFISYGLYLVHELTFHLSERLLSPQLVRLIASGNPTLAILLRFAGGAALGTGIAYLSRRSLEERFLRMGRGLHHTRVSSDATSAPVEEPARTR